MHPTAKAARTAGALYLVLVLTAPFSLIYVPGKLIVRGDTAATAVNILNHEMLFRAATVGELLESVLFIFVLMALYRLFAGVDRMRASLMVILGLVSVAVTFAFTLNNVAALALLKGNAYLTVFDEPHRQALALMFIHLHGQGNFINEMFWGMWLFPFGALVMRSGFLPRVLGLWLLANGAAYVALCVVGLVFPELYGNFFRAFQPLLLGEVAITLWLIIKGARPDPRLMDPATGQEA